MGFMAGKIEEIRGLTGKYTQEFSGLTATEMDTKLGPDRWSMNECLDHIIQSNSTFHGKLKAIASGTYRTGIWGRIPFLPALWGKMILKTVKPEYAGKSKTFSVFQPSSSHYGKNVTSEFTAANEELIKLFQNLPEADLDTRIVSSPVTNFINYSLRTTINILVEHEKRHFNQATRVKQAVLDQAQRKG